MPRLRVYQVELRETVRSDLDAVLRFIADQSGEVRARMVIEAIMHEIGTLCTLPRRHSLVGGRPGSRLRSVVVKSYRILYEIHETSDVVDVLRVVHAARDPSSWPAD